MAVGQSVVGMVMVVRDRARREAVGMARVERAVAEVAMAVAVMAMVAAVMAVRVVCR